jgi:hypothetical protein
MSNAVHDCCKPSMTLVVRLRPVLAIQVLWASLASGWSLLGYWLVHQEIQAPGPTASWPIGVLLAVIACVLVSAALRRPRLYAVLSAVMLVLAIAGVWRFFASDVALWPSLFWHYAGGFLDVAGVLSSLIGLTRYWHWRSLQRR